ncbi:MAG: Crp/Fnr family transcriptional regulator [Bacteroidales bacterium]|jgi:signal-transduction protein with cAMP-binding, CBS, and nucleotidyltransferase domain|nr:Crp/Fnr family transcriptional regulator [Bacteroidales bacterium]
MDGLLANIEKHIDVSDDLRTALRRYFKRVEYKKNVMILDIDSPCNKLFFIEKGECVTFYYQEGREVVSFVYPEGYWVTNWSGFFLQERSEEAVKAISDTVLYQISYNDFESLYKEFPIMERFSRKNMEFHVAFSDKMYRGYSFGSPTERYNHLLKHFPEITQIATLGKIASVLGISRETLSRIRSKK